MDAFHYSSRIGAKAFFMSGQTCFEPCVSSVLLHEFLDSIANLFRLNAGRKTDRRTLFLCDLIHQHACS